MESQTNISRSLNIRPGKQGRHSVPTGSPRPSERSPVIGRQHCAPSRSPLELEHSPCNNTKASAAARCGAMHLYKPSCADIPTHKPALQKASEAPLRGKKPSVAPRDHPTAGAGRASGASERRQLERFLHLHGLSLRESVQAQAGMVYRYGQSPRGGAGRAVGRGCLRPRASAGGLLRPRRCCSGHSLRCLNAARSLHGLEQWRVHEDGFNPCGCLGWAGRGPEQPELPHAWGYALSSGSVTLCAPWLLGLWAALHPSSAFNEME